MSGLAILQTGRPPAALEERFGTYPDMFADLLALDGQPSVYDAAEGELPDRADGHSAYLITGSAAGVYEPHAWIGPLKDFLRAARGKSRLVGICFGHQIMAEAFGGRVAPWSGGWGIGLQRYQLVGQEPWMDHQADIRIPASHQDQVVQLPARSRIVAQSAFNPIAALAYEDHPSISFQFHPEFSPDYAAALVETRRHKLPQADAAILSLDAPNDRARVGQWIRTFLRAA